MSLSFGMTIPEWPPEKIEELAKKYENPYWYKVFKLWDMELRLKN
jgi:hypothetical protein